MVFNKFAAGKKVYSNGKNAPTQGRVNPQGYIQREVKNQAQKGAFGIKPFQTLAQQNRGRDGQSDARSGLAQQAIANRDKLKYETDPRILTGSPSIPRFVDQASYDAWIKKNTLPKDQQQTGGKGVPMKAQPVGGITNITPPPHMKINENGQLDLPYDEGYAFSIMEGQQGLNQSLLELQMQQQQQGMEFANLKRDAGFDYENLKRAALNNASARGMAFSSGYGHDVAQNANAFNTYMNDLEAQNTMFNQGIGSQRTAIENAFNDLLRRAAYERGLALEDEAGDLGFGQDILQPSIPAPVGNKPKPKPAPKPAAKPKPKPKANQPKGGRPGNHHLSKPKPKAKPKGKK